jgi:hypothetical protein
MTGIKQYNFPKFIKEAKRLRFVGYEVVNPAEIAIQNGFDPIKNPDIVCTEAMRRKFLDEDKRLLDGCEGIATLTGWQESKGCDEEIEHFMSRRPSISDVLNVPDWIRRKMDEAAIPSLQKEVQPPIRTFSTGATRDTDTNKIDFDGFLCPLVLERYAEYMHANRRMADGSMRDSSNWKAGIPQDVYRKSGWRHFFSFWKHCLSGNKPLAIVDACGILFNTMGWMHEELKHDNNRTA